MNFTDVVRRRRMVRAYDPAWSPTREQVAGLLDLAVRAPSAGFSQGWHFLVLDSADDRTVFWEATTDGEPDRWLQGMSTAPVLILVLSEPATYLNRYAEPDKGWTDRDPSRWPVPYWDVDAGMAGLLILLGAVDAGMGACFFGVAADRVSAVRTGLGIPPDRNIVGVISLGRAAPDRRSPSLARGRRTGAEVTSWGRFGLGGVARETRAQ